MKTILSIIIPLFLLPCCTVILARGEMGFKKAPSRTIFGVPRGGGLFGKKDEKESATTKTVDKESAAAAAASPTGEKYPPLSREEIEGWLDTIPVYAMTDEDGQPVVLKPDGKTSSLFFFLSPVMANATRDSLKNSTDMDLKISAFSLGQIWFTLLVDGEAKEAMIKPTDNSTSASDVDVRLYPDVRDLMGARMLLTTSKEDGEKLKKRGAEAGVTEEMARAAIRKAMTESPKFNNNYNEVPVFLIGQMRIAKSKEDGSMPTDPNDTYLPMYLNLQNMVTTWQTFMQQAPPEQQSVEPAIQLMSLHEIVELMQTECEIDFRKCILMPTIPIDYSKSSSSSGDLSSPKPTMEPMGGATLGDL